MGTTQQLKTDIILNAIKERDDYYIRCAILYDGTSESCYEDTLLYLDQSILLNTDVEGVDVSKELSDLKAFDLVLMDESLLSSDKKSDVEETVETYVQNGGFAVVPCAFHDTFSEEFFGASSFVEIPEFPEKILTPDVGKDYLPMQQLISDYHHLLPQFHDVDALARRSFGVAMVPATARALVTTGSKDTALYAYNEFGNGAVLFTNPLLPDMFSASSFSLKVRSDSQGPFSNATASCNQLFLSEVAGFRSKEIYGMALYRVFGTYGTPSMSWELHYEDITGIENDSIGQFSRMSEAKGMPVSFTLVRNPYVWFEQAETMTYALNEGEKGALSFCLDRYESAYSSGVHIAVKDRWLQLNALQNCGSYFDDNPEENYRLFPCLTDYDKDGFPDFFCGSADGSLYFFRGLEFGGRDGRLVMDEAIKVSGIERGGYSAPCVMDVDGDGTSDLVTGAADGVLKWHRGVGALQFEEEKVLLETEIPGQCLPAAGDVDGDGVMDLMVGSDQGILLLFYGQREGDMLTYTHGRMTSLSAQMADLEYGKWLSPCLYDLTGDGDCDIALGLFDGYVALFTGDGAGAFSENGFIESEDLNYKGNSHLKFGTYCTPLFADLNGDEKTDLICGHQEYGMAYPIDSAYFPFKEDLVMQIAEAKNNHRYIGMHYLCGAYHSMDRERAELALHKSALSEYGIDDVKGVNQHTWHLSGMDTTQSFKAMGDAGLLWQSGYEPAGAYGQSPHIAAENAIALPFYFSEDGNAKRLLVQNCSLLPYRDDEWTNLHAAYDMPVLVYYHCDYMYCDDSDARKTIEKVRLFCDEHEYNFVTEDRMMYATAAAYHMGVSVREENGGIVIASEAEDTSFALYREEYTGTCGIRMAFSDNTSGAFEIDADVYRTTEKGTYVGLNREVRIVEGTTKKQHITRISRPAKIRTSEKGAEISFVGGGMAELAVTGDAETDDSSWSVSRRNGQTVFSGSLEDDAKLVIRFKEN